MTPVTRRSIVAAAAGSVALAFARGLAAAEPDAVALARLLEARYAQAQSLGADFTQLVVLAASGERRVARGRLLFARPGKMSFRFDPPHGGRVVSDGKTLRVYDPSAKIVYRSKLSLSPYPAALAFLTGGGALERDFALRKLEPEGAVAGFVLEAVPRDASPAFARLLFWLEPSGAARRALVVDAQGNTNRFDLSGVALDVPVSAKDFELRVPPGTTVVRAS